MPKPKRKLKLLHPSTARSGSLYFVKEDTTGATDLPVANVGYSDPRFDVDLYALSCDKLQELKADMQAYLSTIRLTPEVSAYYEGKMSELETVLQAKCGGSVKPIETLTPKTPDPVPPPPPVPDPAPTPPVTVTPSPTPTGLPGVTVNVGDTSGINPTPGAPSGGAASGGGGGGESSKKPEDKKSNWWLWAICIGAFTLSLYKGRNTTIKMPG